MGFFDRLFGRPTKDDFAHAMIKAVRASGERGEIDYDPKEFKLKLRGADTVHHLQNVYLEFLAARRKDRPAYLQRLVRVWAQAKRASPKAMEEVRDRLLPRVRERAYYDLIGLSTGFGHMDFQPQPMCEHLCVNAIVDYPDMVTELSGKILKDDWGVTLAEVLKPARENLWKISNENFVTAAPGVFRSPWCDNHDASRAYLHDLIWQLKVKGRHVIATPNRDTLFVTGTDDEEGLFNLSKLIDAAKEEPRFMTAQLAALNGSAWETWLPPREHPAFLPLFIHSMRSRGSAYNEQKAGLQKRFEKEGADIFVATFSAMSQEGSDLPVSYCVWSKDVHSWLPRTDLVAFFNNDLPEDRKSMGIASWETVQQHAGALMKPQGLYLERWEVKEFPSPEMLANLRLAGVPEGPA
ncbi:MAG: hypothetical protein KIS92_17485 [Planctomycetota bacterium]|nr:hypothetical protein [Planctomycetota bacterium]